MAKNEAKIKFTAETSGFNDAIKQSNDEMAKLRAELKLNAEQMKTTGGSVEELEKQHAILEDQLKASHDKTEALSSKLEVAKDIFGENSTEVSKLETQLLNAQTAEEKIKQAIEATKDALDKQAEASKEAESATGKLTDEIKSQESQVKKLKDEYVDAVLEYGETSDEAKNLADQIENLSTELKENKDKLSDAASKADDLDASLDSAGDSARNSGDGFTVAKGAIADLASEAVQLAIDKVSELIDYFVQLPEATRELRQDMATLDTSFESAGFSTEQATNTWKELYTVFGEDDRAVEAANMIAKISDNQEDLNSWVTITKGVWGQYQDSLPVEGLAEASNETAKTGQVTGVLADALNWSSEAAEMFAGYMNDDVTTAEDAFNVALSECTTEAERQALITKTLTALYGDSAKAYEEASGQQIAAKEASAENLLVQNQLADAIEPMTTTWQGLKNELLSGFIPVAKKVSNWGTDAMSWMKKHPVAVKAIATAVGVLAIGLGGLAIAAGVYTAAQWAMNSAILANPITWVIAGIIAAIAAVAAIIVVVIEYWDEIKLAVQNCVDAISTAWGNFISWISTNVIQPIAQFFSNLWNSIKETASSLWEGVKSVFSSFVEWINTSVIQPIVNFFTGLWTSVQAVWDGICNGISIAIQLIASILSAAFQIITLPFMFIWENCKQYVFAAWEWIKNAISTAVNAISSVVQTVFNAVASFISTVWNGCKSVIETVWNAIKTAVTTAVNAVKSTVTTVWNTIKTVTSTVFNAVKSVVTTVWNAIKTAVTTAVNAVKTKVTTIWNTIKAATSTAFNAVKSTAQNIWNGIKNAVTNAVDSVKSKVTTIWTNIKTTTSSVFNSVKSTVTSIWNGIKNAISTPLEAAKTKVKSVIDAIKGFFDFEFKWPDVKMPHFKITPSGWKVGDLLKGSIPKLGIEWYAKGAILNKPTVFGVNGNNAMVGGEAGPEAILPIDRLEGYIENVVERSMNVVNLGALADAIEDLASRPIAMHINDREFMTATASAGDDVNGLRNSFISRGLILE